MGGIRFILGFHAHQPVGNLPEVFAQAYQRSYLPFFDVLSEFSEVPFTLHYSGVLFDWLEVAHPEFLDRLAGFIARDQVELLRADIMSQSWWLFRTRTRSGRSSG
jgi:alpha-amylase/alpha-mannosidase (GH57 family)